MNCFYALVKISVLYFFKDGTWIWLCMLCLILLIFLVQYVNWWFEIPTSIIPFWETFVCQSATISVWICWKSAIFKVYLLLAILPLKHLPLLQYWPQCYINQGEEHFHGISMKAMQFHQRMCETGCVKQNVIYGLSLLDNSRN